MRGTLLTARKPSTGRLPIRCHAFRADSGGWWMLYVRHASVEGHTEEAIFKRCQAAPETPRHSHQRRTVNGQMGRERHVSPRAQAFRSKRIRRWTSGRYLRFGKLQPVWQDHFRMSQLVSLPISRCVICEEGILAYSLYRFAFFVRYSLSESSPASFAFSRMASLSLTRT